VAKPRWSILGSHDPRRALIALPIAFSHNDLAGAGMILRISPPKQNSVSNEDLTRNPSERRMSFDLRTIGNISGVFTLQSPGRR
jgi:hypothetical protein